MRRTGVGITKLDGGRILVSIVERGREMASMPISKKRAAELAKALLAAAQDDVIEAEP